MHPATKQYGENICATLYYRNNGPFSRCNDFAPAAEARTKAAPRCAPVTTAAVEAQFDKFNASWATKNPDAVAALFGKDAVLLATVSNRPRTDSAGIRDYFVSFLKNSPVGTITSSTVDLGCNMATRVGTWTVTFTDAAGTKSVTMR